MTSAAAVLALCRFGQDAAATLLWGAAAYLCAFVPPGLAAVVASRLRPLAAAAVAVAVLAVAAKLPAEVAGIGDGWRDAVDTGMVCSVLLETSVGRAWMAEAAGVLLLAAAAASPARWRTAAVAASSGLVLASLALEGHATLHEGRLGALDRANDVLHVLSGGAWVGSLAPVLVILAASPGDAGEVATALRRFSRAGHAAVALVLLSGILSTALVLGRWPLDLASPYEALLDGKIACVVAMTALALVNRYVLVPRMGRAPDGAVRALRLGTLAEVPLGLAAIALVAVFGLLDPS